MSGTKSSAIWKYFEIPTEENKKYAKCKLCGEMKSLGSIIPRYRTLVCLKNHIKRQSIYVLATISLANHYHNISSKAFILRDRYNRFSSNGLQENLL